MICLTDLFTIGLGCELAAAYLLARGLLVSTPELVRRSTGFYDFSAPAAAAQASDRVDARTGLFAFAVGFLIQGVAYVLAAAGVSSSSTCGAAAGVVAGSLALAAAAFVIAIWSATREEQLKRLVLEIAHYGTGSPTRHELPSARRLLLMGQEIGLRPTRDEATRPDGTRRYAERVFNVTEFRPGDELDALADAQH